MDAILQLIRDQAWQFAGAIIGLVALIVSVVLYLFSRQRKLLAYEIVASEPLLTINEALTGAIKVIYDDKEVRDVHLLILRVSNSGNIPIRKEDFDLSLAFSFDSAKVLSYKVLATDPEGLPASLRPSGGKRGIVLNPLLLNPSDSVVLKFILSQYNNELEPTGRVVGVKQIQRVTRPKAGLDPLSIRSLVFLCVFIVVNIVINLPFSPTPQKLGFVAIGAFGTWILLSLSIRVGVFLLDGVPELIEGLKSATRKVQNG